MTRAERVREAQQLRAQGLKVREIAARMGVSRSSVGAYLADPDLSKQKERRKRYAGACVDCGAATDGSMGRALAPKRCGPCRKAYEQSDEFRASVTVWTRDRILAAIRWWADTYGEAPAMPDWNPFKCRRTYGDDARGQRAEQLISEGRVPSFRTVVDRFGTWNTAISAAGFEPRPAHGGGGNQAHRRSVRAKAAA